MKRALLLLSLVALTATATPVDNMVAHCEVVMQAGVCKVDLDTRQYTKPTIFIAGVGAISTASYLKIRNAGPEMCNVVREVCSSWNSDDCKAARSLWRSQIVLRDGASDVMWR